MPQSDENTHSNNNKEHPIMLSSDDEFEQRRTGETMKKRQKLTEDANIESLPYDSSEQVSQPDDVIAEPVSEEEEQAKSIAAALFIQTGLSVTQAYAIAHKLYEVRSPIYQSKKLNKYRQYTQFARNATDQWSLLIMEIFTNLLAPLAQDRITSTKGKSRTDKHTELVESWVSSLQRHPVKLHHHGEHFLIDSQWKQLKNSFKLLRLGSKVDSKIRHNVENYLYGVAQAYQFPGKTFKPTACFTLLGQRPIYFDKDQIEATLAGLNEPQKRTIRRLYMQTKVQTAFEDEGLTFEREKFIRLDNLPQRRYYIDFVFKFNDGSVFVEVDERQHKDRPASEESIRGINIRSAMDRDNYLKPIMLLRFNPDEYTATGAMLTLEQRIAKLVDFLKLWTFASQSKSLQLKYMFYDTDDNNHLNALRDVHYDVVAASCVVRECTCCRR
jgi:hypothetical protein